MIHADKSAHEWYRFVLSFPPHLVREYSKRFSLKQNSLVLDPFCGTGTTLVECKKIGIPSVGVESHPMSCFASQTKVDWEPNGIDLLDHANRIATRARCQLAAQGIPDTLLYRRGGLADLRTLPPEVMDLLLTDSISPRPLHKALVLLENIREMDDERFRDHELLALAKALVNSISNLHFGPEVGVVAPKDDCEVVSAWLAVIEEMSIDLRVLAPLQTTRATAHRADSREIEHVLPPRSVDAVITSPPYPNEKDYTRTTRLESVILGFISTKAELRRVKHGLIRSNTRNVYKDDADDLWIRNQSDILAIAAQIEARRIELGKTSGFEKNYAKVTRQYFGGMARHLETLKKILRPGAQLAYVVGDQASFLRVMIRTGQLLAAVASERGYEVLAIDLFRTRLATATREQLREEVILLRWPG